MDGRSHPAEDADSRVAGNRPVADSSAHSRLPVAADSPEPCLPVARPGAADSPDYHCSAGSRYWDAVDAGSSDSRPARHPGCNDDSRPGDAVDADSHPGSRRPVDAGSHHPADSRLRLPVGADSLRHPALDAGSRHRADSRHHAGSRHHADNRRHDHIRYSRWRHRADKSYVTVDQRRLRYRSGSRRFWDDALAPAVMHLLVLHYPPVGYLPVGSDFLP